MEVKFLPATRDDIEKIYFDMKAVMCAYEQKHVLMLEDELMALYNRIKANLSYYRIVRYMGNSVGHFCFRETDGHMVIEDICIDNYFRYKGACTQILRKCISETELPIVAEMYATNTAAVSVFRTNGFIIKEWINDRKFVMIYKNDQPFSGGDFSVDQRISDFIKNSVKPEKPIKKARSRKRNKEKNKA